MIQRKIILLALVINFAWPAFGLEKLIDTQTQKNLGTTNYHRLPGQTQFTNNAVFEALSFGDISVSITASQVLASTNAIGTGSNFVFYLYSSVDRVHLESTPFQTLRLTLEGTNNPTTLVTNFPIAGIPYIHFYASSNGASSNAYVTNLTVFVHGKSGTSIQKASQAQAEAGTENSRYMTALRTAQAISALGGGGGSTNNVTLTGSTVIGTNLLVTAVPSATIGGTNVFEVVNQQTNKIFQVGTNGRVYMPKGLYFGGFNDPATGLNALDSGNVYRNIFYLDAGDQPSYRPAKSGGFIYFNNYANTVRLFGFKDDGSMGIGTAAALSPAAKLDVVGDIRASTTITATNGLAVATNYVAANMIPQQGLIKLVGSNNVLFIVTTTTTNQIP